MANPRPDTVTAPSPDSTDETKKSEGPGSKPRRGPRPGWIQVTPFFLSAILFLSGFFALFCALPLQVLGIQRRWKVLILSSVVNTAWVFVLGGPTSLVIYLIYGLVPGVLLGVLLSFGVSINKSLAATVSTMAATAATALLLVAAVHRHSPVAEVHQQISVFLHWVETSLAPEAREGLMAGMDPADWGKAFFQELPSALVLFALGQVWLSLVFLVRANPGGILGLQGLRPELIRNWRVPDPWVWPTLACGVFMVFEVPQVTPWAMNGFRMLMGLYLLQGLSILGAFLDSWKIRGLLRSGIYVAGLFLMMPLILSIGFFDQWFDFRKNLRQST